MKEQELKSIIKEVVRECVKEACGGGHLAGGEKGKRMFKHIKKGYDGEKDSEDAERIAAATVNKQLGKEGKGEQIPKGKLAHLNPKIADDGANKKLNKGTSSLPSPIKKANEAGALSEYSEDEEIRLIKGLHLITKKLLDMHGNADTGEHEEDEHGSEEKVDENGPQYKVRDGTSQVEQPGQVNRSREIQEDPIVNENKKASSRRKMLDKKFKKGLKDTKKICEFLMEEYGAGPQYKVRDGTSQVERPGEVNRARDIANEPEVNEASYKVQNRSQTSVSDTPMNPENVADPEVPMT